MRSASDMINYCINNDYFFINNSTVRPIFYENFSMFERNLLPTESVKIAFTGILNEENKPKIANVEEENAPLYAFVLTNKHFACTKKLEYMRESKSISIYEVTNVSLSSGLVQSCITIESPLTDFNITVHSDVATKLYEDIYNQISTCGQGKLSTSKKIEVEKNSSFF